MKKGAWQTLSHGAHGDPDIPTGYRTTAWRSARLTNGTYIELIWIARFGRPRKKTTPE